jgi:hypothetical protein
LLAAFVLSDLTYRYVERPVQKHALLPSRRQLLGVLGAASILFIALGALGIATHGGVVRFPEPVRPLLLAAQETSTYRCGKLFRILNPSRELCPRNDVPDGDGLLIVGDSHADVLDDMVGEVGSELGMPVYLTIRNCDLDQFHVRPDCSGYVLDRIISEARSSNVRTILLPSFWRKDAIYEAFVDPVIRFREAGMTMYFVEVVPHGAEFDPTWRAKALLAGERPTPGYTLADYRADNGHQLAILAKLKAEFPAAVRVLSPADHLCPSGVCEIDTHGQPNYFDDDHLSRVGVQRVRPMIAEMLASLDRVDRAALPQGDNPL